MEHAPSFYKSFPNSQIKIKFFADHKSPWGGNRETLSVPNFHFPLHLARWAVTAPHFRFQYLLAVGPLHTFMAH